MDHTKRQIYAHDSELGKEQIKLKKAQAINAIIESDCVFITCLRKDGTIESHCTLQGDIIRRKVFILESLRSLDKTYHAQVGI